MLLQISFHHILVLLSLNAALGGLLLATKHVAMISYYRKKKTLMLAEVQSRQLELETIEKSFQKQLVAAAINSQEAERKRMARDLHDDIGPLLSLATLYLDEAGNIGVKEHPQTLYYFKETRKLLDAAIEQAKRITYDLMPYGLDIIGLQATLASLLGKIGKLKSIKTSYYFQDRKLRLEPEQEMMLYRVVQESLNNIAKHSQASFIHLSQEAVDGNFILELRHDGKGLDEDSFERLRKRHAGMGLKNISSRLQTAGGRLKFNKDDNVFITRFYVAMQHTNKLLSSST